MPTLKIDLATRILKDSMKVYFVHPGARYAFYDHVVRDEVLPVDLPFLELEDKKGLPASDKIAPMLERARQMRKWAKRPQAEFSKKRPAMDLDLYRVGLQLEEGAQGARTKLRNTAQEILWGIPKNSLAIIPHRRITGHAILAEFGSRKSPRKVIDGHDHYEGMKFLARPLRNVKQIPMLDLPSSVIVSARSTKVVEQINGHAEDQLLRLYYGDYQRDKDYVAGVIAHTEDFDALVLAQMIDLHVAIEHFLETGGDTCTGAGVIRKKCSNRTESSRGNQQP